MTLNGAIMQLVELHEHSMMPVFFKPALANVIDTISELEEPTQTNAEATQDFGKDTNVPSNDCISRQAAIDALCAVCGNDCNESEFVYNAPQCEQVILCPEHYVLSTLPSALPQWIPCSERQPLEDGKYIVTVKDGEGMFVTYHDWRQDLKEWAILSCYGESDDPAWRRVTNVVAWMPLPEPYKEEKE